MSRGQWYKKRGIPYRRGYLLHGPPGCGKTSLLLSLAGHFDRSICVLNLSDENLTDDGLALRLAAVPDDAFILLEDVDAAFVSRDRSATTAFQGLNRLTFSGLLNALDGVASSEARILFMTTNYVKRLDKALIRPGRVDCTAKIDHCTAGQMAALFGNFYPDASAESGKQFAAKLSLESEELSPALVQGILLRYKDDFEPLLDPDTNLILSEVDEEELNCCDG